MEEYFDLAVTVLLGVGLIFETPVLIYVLSAFGLVTPGFLWKISLCGFGHFDYRCNHNAHS